MVKLLNPNGVTYTSVHEDRVDWYLGLGFKKLNPPKPKAKPKAKKKEPEKEVK